MSGPSGRGLRREAPILIPAALLLFATLASITLLSYRTAIARFADEREQKTLKQAVVLADAARLLKGDDATSLARWLPPGAALAIYDARGAVRASFGFTGGDALARPVPRASELAAPRVEGLGSPRTRVSARAPALDPEDAQKVRALVPFERAGQRYLLRLDLPEPTLFAQQRSLRILTPVVFGLSLAVALLAMFYLRALVRPYEALLEKARAAAPPGTAGSAGGAGRSPTPSMTGSTRGSSRGSDDEVEFLLATFDRALAALRSESASAAAPGAFDELSAVERTLGPQLESGLLMFDREGRLLAANPAAVELLGGAPAAPPAIGAAREAGTGSAPKVALAAASDVLATHPELASVIAVAIERGRSIPRASVAIERAGRRVELGVTLQALRRSAEAGGGVGGLGPAFLVLFADVTDLTRREAEERFAAGLAQLGELSAGVAHELRNSLATVQGYLALAARRALPAEAREELAEAQREAQALAGIVDDFLTFARPGSGVLEPVDLAALLRHATSDPALAGVDFELVLPQAALPAIAGDAQLLQRALRNLLLNAAQATLARAAQTAQRSNDATGEMPGPVVVGLRSDSGAVQITIDDCGTGLPPEIADRLFEPFASGRPGGAGLGLALARRIVLMHGGTLTLAAREPYGVRAEIRLPSGNIATESS